MTEYQPKRSKKDRFLDRLPVFGRVRRIKGWVRRKKGWIYFALIIAILFVVRPRGLHPRAAFEIDQFVQRGGRLVVAADDVQYSWYTHETEVRPSCLRCLQYSAARPRKRGLRRRRVALHPVAVEIPVIGERIAVRVA